MESNVHDLSAGGVKLKPVVLLVMFDFLVHENTLTTQTKSKKDFTAFILKLKRKGYYIPLNSTLSIAIPDVPRFAPPVLMSK